MNMIYTIPRLDYPYNALEPAIDARTMEIHLTKHHQAYVTNLNTVLEKYPDLSNTPLPKLLENLDSISMADSDKVFFKNNAGGHINHEIFWSIMGPHKKNDTALIREITAEFGSLKTFQERFSDIAVRHFGSGWAWLIRNREGKLLMYTKPNQDSPYLFGHTPIIGLDLWEHAYYLSYQNRRADYIKSWWTVFTLF